MESQQLKPPQYTTEHVAFLSVARPHDHVENKTMEQENSLKQNPRERLIRRPFKTDPSTLDDLLLVIAGTIEDSLASSGAIPDQDYTIMDLYRLASPYALHIFKKGETTFTGDWSHLEGLLGSEP